MTKFLIPFLFLSGVLIVSMYTIPNQASATYIIDEDSFPDQITSNRDVYLCQSAYALSQATLSLFSQIIDLVEPPNAEGSTTPEATTKFDKAYIIYEKLETAFSFSETLAHVIQLFQVGIPIETPQWRDTVWSVFGVTSGLFIISLLTIFFTLGIATVPIQWSWTIATWASELVALIGIPECGSLMIDKTKKSSESDFFADVGTYLTYKEITKPEFSGPNANSYSVTLKAYGNPDFTTVDPIETSAKHYECGVFVAYPKDGVNRGDTIQTFTTLGTIAHIPPFEINMVTGDIPDAGRFFKDEVIDTNINTIGHELVGVVTSEKHSRVNNLEVNTKNLEAKKYLLEVDRDRILKAVKDLQTDLAKNYGTYKMDTYHREDRSYDIFFLKEQKDPHKIGFSGSLWTVHAKAGHSLSNVYVTVKEDIIPTIIPPDRIKLEKTFPDGAYVPKSFEQRIIDSSTPLDDCTESNQMKVTTDLYSHLNSQGRLPSGETIINLYTADRWGNEGTAKASVLVLDTIPPDIHPMSPLGVLITPGTDGIHGDIIMAPNYPDLGDPVLMAEPFTFDLGSFNPHVECFVGEQSCDQYEFQIGTTNVMWEVTDTVDNKNSIPQEIRVREIGVNNLPSGLPRSIDVAKGILTEIVVGANDADGDKLQFKLDKAPLLGGLRVDDNAIFQNRFISEGTVNDFASFEIIRQEGINELSEFVTLVLQPGADRVLVYNNRVGLIDIIEKDELGSNVDEIVRTPSHSSFGNAISFWAISWSDKKISNMFYCVEHGASEQWPCNGSQTFTTNTIDLPTFSVNDSHSVTTDGENFYFLANNSGSLELVKINLESSAVDTTTIESSPNTPFVYSDNTFLTLCGVQCGDDYSFLLAYWGDDNDTDHTNDKKIFGISSDGIVQESWDLLSQFTSELELKQNIKGDEAKLISPAGIKINPESEVLSLYIGDSRRSNILIMDLVSNKGELASEDNFGMKFIDINALETDYDDNVLVAGDRGITKFAYGGTLLNQSTELM